MLNLEESMNVLRTLDPNNLSAMLEDQKYSDYVKSHVEQFRGYVDASEITVPAMKESLLMSKAMIEESRENKELFEAVPNMKEVFDLSYRFVCAALKDEIFLSKIVQLYQ